MIFSLNVGQKYCRKLQRERSAILSTFIKLTFISNIFVLSIIEWPLNPYEPSFLFVGHRQTVKNQNRNALSDQVLHCFF